MIVDLKSDKIYEPITFESAEKIRNDKLSPVYWGLVWRDLKTTPTKFLKPIIYRHKYLVPPGIDHGTDQIGLDLCSSIFFVT